MTDILPQAITAALGDLSKHDDMNLWLTAAEGTVGGLLARKDLITRAVVAAAPHLAADVLARVEQGIIDGAGEVIAQAVAAERERCADLAERLAATVPVQGGRMSFADVLRRQEHP